MAQLTLKELSHAMRSIDICMLSSIAESGAIESRPMSNNRDVEYNGESYFFTNGSTEVARSLGANSQVNLAYTGKPLLGKNIYIAIGGKAELIRDKAAMRPHWVPDLDAWFEQGIDTPGLVMIRVVAERITYWQGREEGTIMLPAAGLAKSA